jgi:hypothetical protein
MAKFPDNACPGLRLYFKSPSLGQIKVIDVDATPDEDGEVELLSDGIAELTRRWCAALNRMRKVNDFRPATREEVGAFVRRQYSVDKRQTAPKPRRVQQGRCPALARRRPSSASLAAAILACRSEHWLHCGRHHGPGW